MFERFARDARAAVVAALDVAQRSGARTADIEIAGGSAEVRRPPVLTPKNILRRVDGRWYIDRR